MGEARPAARRVRGEGAVRVALAGAVLLMLVLWWTPQDAAWAYLAAFCSAVFGLSTLARPNVLARLGFARAALDAPAVGLLVADTGGSDSPFVPLYFAAALALTRSAAEAGGGVRSLIEGLVASALLVGGYLTATILLGGWDGTFSRESALGVGLLAFFCAATLRLGYGLRSVQGRSESLSTALAAELQRAGKAKARTGALGPALASLTIESALGLVAEAARVTAGASYSHVASLRGNLHHTVMRGNFRACPSWWHPSVQRLVLWSCREGRVVREEDAVHGLQGLTAVPLGAAGGEAWGAIVVGGEGLGAGEERALLELADVVRPALERGPDAGGGVDPASGLPNAASLARVLRREISEGGAPALLAVGIRPGPSATGEDPIRALGARLEDNGQRAFRYDGETLIVLVGNGGKARIADKARALRRLAREEAEGVGHAPAGPAVGFALAGSREPAADKLVSSALRAVETARTTAEKVSGATDGAPEDPGTLAGCSPPVRGLLKAMAAHDPYLHGHAVGVSRVAARIGRALSFPEERIDALKVGALLHDVGKIGVSDMILRKPGPLSEEEYGAVKRHPAIGAGIIAEIPALSSVLPAIRNHHERFDGLGYPDGLGGEDIPPIARVVAVADAFDSMTRERPYGRRRSDEEAAEEVMNQAGTQFDPRVAEALSRAVAHPDDPSAGDDIAV